MARQDEADPRIGRLDDLAEPVPTQSSGLRAGAEDPLDTGVSAAVGLSVQAPKPRLEGDGPGEAIRVARRRIGIDTANLARRMRLSTQLIEDLEANRFEAMPPAYVRGYLRAVARELGGPADEWVRAYEALGYAEPEVKPRAQPQRMHRVARGPGLRATLVGVILVGLLAAGVYAWKLEGREEALAAAGIWARDLVGGRGGPADAADALTVPAPVPADVALEAAPPPFWEPPPVAPQLPVAAASPAAVPAVPAAPVATEPAGDAAPASPVFEPVPEASAAPTVAVDAGLQPASAAAAPAESSPSAAESPAEAAPTAPALAVVDPPPPGYSELGLAFSAESWVEIRSASGRTVLAGLFQPGEDRSVLVELPARILIGNAGGVELSQDGQRLDLTPHMQPNRTARLTLAAE
jgi:cytoskeleton protein RodZ